VVEFQTLSMSAMSALERLNPVERAVLLLRDVFDLDYSEVADIVDKSPSNVRQIAKRARDHAGDLQRARVPTDVEALLISRYLDAVGRGDVEGLAEIFAEDVLLVPDGGGNARAARHTLHGSLRVARHLIGVSPQAPDGMEVRVVRVNGEPSIMGIFEGRAIGIVTLEIREQMVTAVRASLNPEKLAHVRSER
jgi:RNA polymerase sigma-70 factor (ECF subfamily)